MKIRAGGGDLGQEGGTLGQQGAPPCYFSLWETLLHVAVNKQHLDCVKVLLQHKANVNIQVSFV